MCIGLWVGFIFYQGSRSSEVSIELSNKIVNKLVAILHDLSPSSNPVTIYRLIHLLIRKMAHVFEYALLGGGLFFYFRYQNAILHDLSPSSNPVTIYRLIHLLIRKMAHVFEYALLGGGLFFYFRYQKCTTINRWIYTLFIVLLFATLDEYIQSFVGRTSSVRDVLLDFTGGIIGNGSFLFLSRKIKEKNSFISSKNPHLSKSDL